MWLWKRCMLVGVGSVATKTNSVWHHMWSLNILSGNHDTFTKRSYEKLKLHNQDDNRVTWEKGQETCDLLTKTNISSTILCEGHFNTNLMTRRVTRRVLHWNYSDLCSVKSTEKTSWKSCSNGRDILIEAFGLTFSILFLCITSSSSKSTERSRCYLDKEVQVVVET